MNGGWYGNGIGTKQDFFEAALWFRQAALRRAREGRPPHLGRECRGQDRDIT